MPSAPTDYSASIWADLRARKLADGWPMPGDQSDGSYVEWASNPSAYEPTRYITHKNYLRFLLTRKGKAKQTLLCKIYLQQGKDEMDKASVLKFVNANIHRSNSKLREMFADEIKAIEQTTA